MENETGRPSLLKRVKNAIYTLFHIHAFVFEILKRLDVAENRLDWSDKRLDCSDKRLDWSDKRLDALETNVDFILHNDGEFIQGLTNRMIRNRAELQNLNRELSIVPTLWGNPDRLHISPLASVYPCFFNTNSGEITIGDYTFAGSRVSILAGSHDYHLTGFLRRDADLIEGCNITIGKGVWLASDCTILGPCTIEDNAVIAAGAVVIPGTIVPANSIYGGIPAKEIGQLETKDELKLDSPEIQEAYGRSQGLLFVDGWTEKKIFPGLPVVGHFLTGTGLILVKETTWLLYYGIEGESKGTIFFRGSKSVLQIDCEEETGKRIIKLPCSGDQAELISVDFSLEKSKLFIMLSPLSEDDKSKE